MSHAPAPLDPNAVLDDLRRRAAEPVHVASGGPASDDWFPLQEDVRLDDGLTIAEANALALFQAAPIRLARAEAGVAGAQVLQAGVLANPQFFVGPRISSADSGLVFPASLTWELPLWGRHDARRDVAAARLGEREVTVVEVELDTLLDVRRSYLRLARLRREEGVLAAAAAASGQIVGWVKGLEEAGEADPVAVFLARAEDDELHAELERVRSHAARERRALLATVGLLPDASVEPVLDATSVNLPALDAPDDDALLGVPSVRAAEASYEAAEATLRLELSRQYPDVRLGPEFEDDRGDSSYGIGLGVTLPVFDRNRGAIAAALEARSLAMERYRSALLEATHAAATARGDLAASERLLSRSLDGAVRDAEEATRAVEIRLRTGRAGVVELLSAQRAISRARIRVIELEEQVAVGRMRAAVAGGLALRRPPQQQHEETER